MGTSTEYVERQVVVSPDEEGASSGRVDDFEAHGHRIYKGLSSKWAVC
jgi:hypothetical protein